jgi:Zn-dependent M16 (insulinase) family peptidase
MNIPETYELIRHESIPDVHAEGYLLRHKKSGARIVLLSNDDENKVFNIAFRTPPADSTGVAHIIEHTVLCGSEKYPLKDPFIELVKGSLNTFLNAMTYPDKTMYPVASCNDTDFKNLMDVYLDAVFHPNIYREEKIFRQEGWHYQLENRDDPITYNGVVYNEMKGAFSSSDEVLQRTIMNTLFPDTAYGVESGGDPEVIPELTYEQFLAFHKKYYHPSNSYIYLYGNMDMTERLTWLDASYLSKYDAAPVSSELKRQKPFASPRFVQENYPVLDDEDTKDRAYLTQSMVTGDALDVTANVAFSILDYVLFSSPGAPVRQALLDAHIGEDVYGSFEDGILQPFFTITAKNADENRKDEFLKIIHDTLSDQADHGIDRTALASGINYFEFRFREADYSSFPKGLIYGLNLFDSWLYDDSKPFVYLRQLSVFDTLKKKAEEGYFEDLIRKYLLDNPYSAVVVLTPKKGLERERGEATAKKLADLKTSMSDEEIDRMVEETHALAAYQEEKDPPEALACLPHLTRADISRETPVKICREEIESEGTLILHHDYFTNGIAYLTVLFDTADVPDRLVPYLGLLKSVLGMVNTERYSYGQLFHLINANTGGISCGIQSFPDRDGTGSFRGFFGVQAKYLYPKQTFVFDMIREILLTSKLDDKKRLREIIASQKVSMQSAMPSAGHATAARRALSYISAADGWQERTDGIDFYHMIEDIDAHFDERADEVIGNLKTLTGILFRPDNFIVSLTADTDGLADADASSGCGLDGLKKEIGVFRTRIATWSGLENEGAERKTVRLPRVQSGKSEDGSAFSWKAEAKNEGWVTPGQVQYVASAGNFRQKGFEYTGALRILKTILSYDYLWINLRVKGGAYGCMAMFQRNGDAALVSYRDPHLAESLAVYRGLPDYIAGFSADEEQMTKYIIGTISEIDTPMNASAKGNVSLAAWFSGLAEEDFQRERDEILDADEKSIRDLEALSHVVADTENICVIGSEAAVSRDADVFNTVGPLIRPQA